MVLSINEYLKHRGKGDPIVPVPDPFGHTFGYKTDHMYWRVPDTSVLNDPSLVGLSEQSQAAIVRMLDYGKPLPLDIVPAQPKDSWDILLDDD